MKMQANKKKTALVSLLLLLAVLATVAAIVIVDRIKRQELVDWRDEMLETLNERVGEYDDKSIVLYNTNEREARELAERFGAKLRITENGKFATLTLQDGRTIVDIFSDENNLKYLEALSADWSARVADVVGDESDTMRAPKASEIKPSDKLYGNQTYLDYINLGSVWSNYTGSGVTVAIIDTGIATANSEFSGRISEYSYNASEDKIVKDYDLSVIEDEQGHGTSVAGVLAAGQNGEGITGVAPNVTLLVIKAECDANGNFERSSDLVFGLYYAIERDVDVVNMSFGGVGGYNIFEDAARLGRDSDVVMVAAAGNNGSANLMYPAADENVIGVGALKNDSWELDEYSNYGDNVNVVAPGTVYTIVKNKSGYGSAWSYGKENGTSFSSPIVAGAIALIKNNSSYKYATNEQIIELLYASSYDIGDPGCDYYYGYGALDVSAFVKGTRGTVKFDYLTDEIDETEQIFIHGNPLQNIPMPERLCSVFDGWYYDIECTNPVNLYEDAFSADLTLYARWTNEDDGVPFEYRVLDDGTVEIISYIGKRHSVSIPSTIDGKEVSSIAREAFKGENGIREITLPDTLVNIGDWAFANCGKLVNIEIPDGVTSIGAYAFDGDARLSYIAIDASSSRLETVGEFAFAGCSKLTSIDLPASLESIDGSAFYGALSLTKINVNRGNTDYFSRSGILLDKSETKLIAYPAGLSGAYKLPDSVRTIGQYAFAYAKMTDVDLNSVVSIGDSAFTCSEIESVVIPDSVIDVGEGIFANCTNLSSVSMGSGLAYIGNLMFLNDRALGSIRIPSGVMSIGAAAFCGTSLSQVDFADGSRLATIGASAFAGTPISSIELPASVMTIASDAFSGCTSLSEVSFGEGSVLTSIGDSAFANTLSLSEISLPASLSEIGGYAFSGSALSGKLEIGKNVSRIGAGAFAYCVSLEEFDVSAENGTYKAHDGVIYTADGTTLVAYPTGNPASEYRVHDGTITIGISSFEGTCYVTSIIVSEGVKEIAQCAFYRCENVTNYNLSSTLEKISEYSFAYNLSLTGLTIPEGIKKIAPYTFYGCYNATNYNLPSTLEEISTYSFAFNLNLNSITIPDNVRMVGKYAFNLDYKLTSINISENTKMSRIGYAAFANTGITSMRIPANISTMGQYAFFGCHNLKSVTFSKGSKLDIIPAYVFTGAENIQTITFESGSALKSLSAHAFEGLTALKTVNFGDAPLTNIDNYAFRYCTSLSTLTLPESVENIGRFAFYKCTSLSELTLPEKTEHIGEYAFYGTADCNLYFKSENLPMYLDDQWDYGTGGYYTGVIEVKTVGDWKYATKTNGKVAIIKYLGTDKRIDLRSVDLGADIDTIGGYAFSGSEIEQIILPETLVDIQRYAFFSVKSLDSVVIPASVKYIAQYAFANSGIKTVTFAGSSVEVIERYAFAYTSNLDEITIPSSVEKIGPYAFFKSGIESLTFEEGFSMTEIPRFAFANTKLTSVTIPDSVTRICKSAFRSIPTLRSVTLGAGEHLRVDANAFYDTGLADTLYIPANLEYIGEYAFIGLEGLKNYEVAEDNPNYSSVDGVLYNKEKTKLVAFPAGREGEFEVPVYVENIGYGAFENSHLESVTFAKGINLLTISWRSFHDADSLTEITLPKSLISIDYFAFANCDKLAKVVFEEGSEISGIYEGAFFGCHELSDITLIDSITDISDYTFYGCTSLTSLPLSDNANICGIYDYAFAYTGLTRLELPESVVDIGNYAFMGTPIESVEIPDKNKKALVIGIGAFANCDKIEEITLPFIGDGYVAEYTWFGYIFGAGGYKANSTYVPESLKKVTVTEGITAVPKYAFYELTSLEEVNLPKTVYHISTYAFYNTTAKYEIQNPVSVDYKSIKQYDIGKGISGDLTISDSVTSIGNWAFYGCTSLRSVTIPDSVTSIAYGAFGNCNSLKDVYYLGTIEDWCNINFNNYRSNPCCNGANLYINGELLTDLVIPDSVTSIDGSTFYGCTSLTSVTIGNGVTSIGSRAFSGCTSLTSVTIPNSVTYIGNNAFNGCSSLKNISIPKSVTNIGGYAFCNCTSLASITIPNSVTSIGDYAFYGCTSLKNVYYQGTLEDWCNIDFDTPSSNPCCNGANLYINGELLTDLIVPDGVTSIGSSAFSGCTSLTSVTIGNGVTSIGSSAFYGCTSLTSVIIPNSVTSIGGNAFEYCTSLTSVTIPNSVTSIGNYAFYYCNNLYKIINKSSIKLTFGSSDNGYIAYYAKVIEDADGNKIYKTEDDGTTYIVTEEHFAFKVEDGTYTLIEYLGPDESITLPRDINGESYSIYGFEGNMKHITIPDSVTSIGVFAFSGCTSLTSVTIPNSVTSISYHAFSDCSSLTNISVDENNEYYKSIDGNLYTKDEKELVQYAIGKNDTSFIIPDSVTSIKHSAFYGCTSLTSITIPDSVTRIGDYAFYGCTSLTSITIPDSVTSIGSSAFGRCTSLTSITIPNSVTSIGGSAFSGCTSIKDVYYLGTLEEWCNINFNSYASNPCCNGANLYINGELLTDLVIPDTVTSIEYQFAGCTSLTSINIPDSVKSIVSSAFTNSDITDIEISADHPYFTYFDGVLYTKDLSKIIHLTKGITEITLPNGITSISSGAFSNCTSLTSVTIPDSVTNIGKNAFEYCTSLESVTIGNGVTSIGGYAFYGCTSLTSVIIPNSVTSIGGNAFEYCTSLTSVTIPDSVTEIGWGEFSFCSSLTSVTIPDSITSIRNTAFYGCTSLESVTIGNGVTSIGWYAFSDCTSLTSIIIPNSVTSIGNQAFFGCSSLTSVTIPNSVTSIGGSAFSGCTSLESVTIGNGVTSIGWCAFSDCTSLTSIIIPNSVTSIGGNAFEYCTSLMSVTIPDSVTSIGGSAFQGCSSLYKIINKSDIEITFSDEWSTIGYYTKVIEDANGNRTYRTDSNGTTYLETADNFLFQVYNGKYTLIAYLGSNESITLPSDINGESYSIYSFRGNMKHITIPDSVTSIDGGAFYGCKSLTSVIGGNGVTYVGSEAFGDTAFYNDPSNWVDGCLYVGKCLIDVDKSVRSVIVRPDTVAIVSDVFDECYSLRELTIGGDHSGLLSSLTNLVTLKLTELPTHQIYEYFGWNTSKIPVTLENVVICSGNDVRRYSLFYYITDVTIYVEDEKACCPWDSDYPGWSNGNKVLYGDEWNSVTYYDSDGTLLETHYYQSSEAIKPPHYADLKDGDINHRFDGWDIDGDGTPDGLPATVEKDYEFHPIITDVTAEYIIKFVDIDGRTPLYTYSLAYGEKIPTPENPTKRGYTFLGWSEIPETATEDLVILSSWLHDGDGHEYFEKIVAPTCDERGYTLRECKICGESKRYDYTDALGHSWGTWITDTAATCTTDGEHHHYCTECGEVEYAMIEATGHNYVIDETCNNTASTCTKQGIEHFKCTECGETAEVTLPLAPHSYVKVEISENWLQMLIKWFLKAFFGYDSNGKPYYYKCEYCGKTLEKDDEGNVSFGIMSAGDTHTLGEWETLESSTFCHIGIEGRRCTDCGEILEVRINEATTIPSTDDAFEIVMHMYFPEKYPITEDCDLNGDGVVDSNDAFWIIMHMYFPEKYPINRTATADAGN